MEPGSSLLVPKHRAAGRNPFLPALPPARSGGAPPLPRRRLPPPPPPPSSPPFQRNRVDRRPIRACKCKEALALLGLPVRFDSPSTRQDSVPPVVPLGASCGSVVERLSHFSSAGKTLVKGRASGNGYVPQVKVFVRYELSLALLKGLAIVSVLLSSHVARLRCEYGSS